MLVSSVYYNAPASVCEQGTKMLSCLSFLQGLPESQRAREPDKEVRWLVQVLLYIMESGDHKTTDTGQNCEYWS